MERLKIMKAALLVEGSFDDAIQGVDGVFHTASPVLVPYDDNIQLWYPYAKTVGEKEAWRIAKEKGLDLVVVNPSFVVGPLLVILAIVNGMRREYPNMRVGFVHIDDVIASHILAMEDKRASGRLLCSSSAAHWSQIIEKLKAKYPSDPYENKCSSREGDNNPHSMDTTKIAQLGYTPFKTLEQMFDDCIKSFQDKGFL